MGGYILRRLGVSALVLLTISSLSFALLKASGDLATSLAGEGSGADYVEFLRKAYGLDRPLWEQYGHWLLGILSGDFGTSFYFGGPVLNLILSRLPVTLTLGAGAIVIAMAISFPLGIIASLRPNGWIDRAVSLVTLSAQATPIFWTSFLLIQLFVLNLGWLPASGAGTPLHFVMPCLALGYYATPSITRIVRGGMIEALESDYVRTAKAKGLRPHAVILQHALRNTLVPVVAVASVQFGFLLGGSVVVETIYALQGIGYLTWEAISQNDYPVVQATVLMVSAFYVVLTLLADLLNAFIDPRIRLD